MAKTDPPGARAAPPSRRSGLFRALSAAGLFLAWAVLVSDAALYGGVLNRWVWISAGLKGLLLLVCALALWARFSREESPLLPHPLLRASALCFGLFALLAVLQLLPLPPGLLALASPDPSGFRFEGSPPTVSLDPAATLDSLLSLLGSLALLLAGLLFAGRSSRLIRQFSGLTLLGGVIAAYALFNYLTHEAFSVHFAALGSSSRARGPFVNPNHLAAFMAILLGAPLLLVSLQKSRPGGGGDALPLAAQAAELASGISRSWWKILASLSFVFMALALVFSLSRGGIIAGVAGCAVFLASFALFRRRREHLRAGRLVLYTAVFLALAAAVLWIGLEPVLRRYAATEISDEVRLQVWTASLRASAGFPLFGTGLGTYGSVSPAFLPPELNARYTFAHNEYVGLLVETGAAGFFLFLAGVVLGAAGALRVVLKNRLKRTRRAGASVAFAAAAAALVSSVTEFALHMPATAGILLFVVGVGLSGIRSQGSHRRRKPFAAGAAGGQAEPEGGAGTPLEGAAPRGGGEEADEED